MKTCRNMVLQTTSAQLGRANPQIAMQEQAMQSQNGQLMNERARERSRRCARQAEPDTKGPMLNLGKSAHRHSQGRYLRRRP